MRLAWLLLPLCLSAQENPDVSDARRVVVSFAKALASYRAKTAASLFAADAEVWDSRGRLASGPDAIRALLAERRTWSEFSPTLLKAGHGREIAPGLVLVDSRAAQYGSVQMNRTVPALLVLRKQDDGWRIVCWAMLGGLPVQ